MPDANDRSAGAVRQDAGDSTLTSFPGGDGGRTALSMEFSDPSNGDALLALGGGSQSKNGLKDFEHTFAGITKDIADPFNETTEVNTVYDDGDGAVSRNGGDKNKGDAERDAGKVADNQDWLDKSAFGMVAMNEMNTKKDAIRTYSETEAERRMNQNIA